MLGAEAGPKRCRHSRHLTHRHGAEAGDATQPARGSTEFIHPVRRPCNIIDLAQLADLVQPLRSTNDPDGFKDAPPNRLAVAPFLPVRDHRLDHHAQHHLARAPRIGLEHLHQRAVFLAGLLVARSVLHCIAAECPQPLGHIHHAFADAFEEATGLAEENRSPPSTAPRLAHSRGPWFPQAARPRWLPGRCRCNEPRP